jgi:anti-sigma B factor antagonist
VTDLASLETQARGELLVATIQGEIDMSNAAELEMRLVDAIKGTSGLALDLSGVTFIDSAGVRLLDHLVVAAEPETPIRIVTDASGPVPFTLRLCGFREDLLAPTMTDAIHALEG